MQINLYKLYSIYMNLQYKCICICCVIVKHKWLFAIIFTATFYRPTMHYLEGVQEIVVQVEYFTSERWKSPGSVSWSNLYIPVHVICKLFT